MQWYNIRISTRYYYYQAKLQAPSPCSLLKWFAFIFIIGFVRTPRAPPCLASSVIRVMKLKGSCSLDMDQNIISCLVYKTDGVAGQVQSPGCHGNHPKLGNRNFKIIKIPLSSPPLQNMVSGPNFQLHQFKRGQNRPIVKSCTRILNATPRNSLAKHLKYNFIR